jgi:hypothetical protein
MSNYTQGCICRNEKKNYIFDVTTLTILKPEHVFFAFTLLLHRNYSADHLCHSRYQKGKPAMDLANRFHPIDRLHCLHFFGDIYPERNGAGTVRDEFGFKPFWKYQEVKR